MPTRHARGIVRKDRLGIWAFLSLILALALVGGVFYGTVHASRDLSEGMIDDITASSSEAVEEQPEPVQQVAVELAPVATFMDQMKAYVPEGYPGPVARMNGAANSTLAWVCNASVSPSPALAVQLDLANNATVVVQAFGAGQSIKAVDNYRNSVASCARKDASGGIRSRNSAIDGTEGFKASTTTGGVTTITNVWARGDVIVSVSAPNADVTNDLTSKYDGAVLQALGATQCVATDVTAADATRSPYYDLAAYTGWQRGREVTLGDKIPGVTAGVLSGQVDVTGSGDRLGVLSVGTTKPSDSPLIVPAKVTLPTKPEDPIEPAALPAVVERPGEAPAAPAVAPVSTVIPERVRDEVGPGCGWAWTGQAAPVYDDTLEKQRADSEQGAAQEALRTGFVQYLQARSSYLDAYVNYSGQVTAYAQYVDQVNAIGAQWAYVRDERAKYRSALDEYYADIAARDKFIADQQAAQTDYDAKVAQCQAVTTGAGFPAKDTQTQPQPQPQPTQVPTPAPTTPVEPTPEPEPTPEIQCPPLRPAILDQQVPAMPQPPAKPDVPLPASWTDVPN